MLFMMKAAYSLATFCGSLICLPLFLCHPRGRRRFLERYGMWRVQHEDELLWFHGAAGGEVAGLLPVIARCRMRFPRHKILLTAPSPTGLENAEGRVDYVRLLPFDSNLWLALALRRLRPSILVFGETELWPNLLGRLARRRVPMVLANGRLSEFSTRYYRWLRPLVRDTLRKLSAVFVLNEKYRERFIEFGADPACVAVNGNAKYDSTPAIGRREDAMRLKRAFFAEDLPVLVLGSLRPGEEEVWFPAMAKALQAGTRINIVVAPRHQEKTAYFAERLREHRLPFEFWSKQRSCSGGCALPIVLLDTLGDLEAAYSFADLAFVGGTLVPGIGGHNALEPAAYGVSVALGPHCENIDDIVAALDQAGAVCHLAAEPEAAALIARVSAGDPALEEAGRRGRDVFRRLSGAGETIVNRMAALL